MARHSQDPKKPKGRGKAVQVPGPQAPGFEVPRLKQHVQSPRGTSYIWPATVAHEVTLGMRGKTGTGAIGVNAVWTNSRAQGAVQQSGVGRGAAGSAWAKNGMPRPPLPRKKVVDDPSHVPANDKCPATGCNIAATETAGSSRGRTDSTSGSVSAHRPASNSTGTSENMDRIECADADESGKNLPRRSPSVVDKRPVSAKVFVDSGLWVTTISEELVTRMQAELPRVTLTYPFRGQARIVAALGEEKTGNTQGSSMRLTVEFS